MKKLALSLLAVLALADPQAAAHDVPGHATGGQATGAEPTQAEITRRIEAARGLMEAKGRMVQEMTMPAGLSQPHAVYTGQPVNPSVHSRTCGEIRVGDIVQELLC